MTMPYRSASRMVSIIILHCHVTVYGGYWNVNCAIIYTLTTAVKAKNGGQLPSPSTIRFGYYPC